MIPDELRKQWCSVQRSKKQRDEVTGEVTFSLIDIVKEVPCHLSFFPSSTFNIKLTKSVDIVEYAAKLFVNPQADIKTGDFITVFDGTEMRNFTAGESRRYKLSTEVYLQRIEEV